MANPLEGTEIYIGYIFHSEHFIDGIFSHTVIALEKKTVEDLRKIHGLTWQPPVLEKDEIKEACPELTQPEIKELRKILKAKTKEKYEN